MNLEEKMTEEQNKWFCKLIKIVEDNKAPRNIVDFAICLISEYATYEQVQELWELSKKEYEKYDEVK